PCAAPAVVCPGRADLRETADAGDWRRSHRACLLSGVSPQRERRRGDPLALRPSPSGVADPWPQTPDELVEVQLRLAALTPPLWRPSGACRVGACFVCFPRGFEGPGAPGDRAWAAAIITAGPQVIAHAVSEGEAAASYRSGFLALREGPSLERAVRALPETPDVLLADATGRDHPRRAGLALHLGARLDGPSIGVKHGPVVACGIWPQDEPR